MRVIKKKDTGELYIVVVNDVGHSFIVSANDERKCKCISNYDLHKEYEQFSSSTNDSCKVERIVQKTQITTWDDIVHGDISEFTVGDVYNVKLSDGEIVPFKIEHIENGKIYFVSKNVLANIEIPTANKWLSDFERELPVGLRKHLCEIEHIVKDGDVKTGKIMLPSLANVFGDDFLFPDGIGADDVAFDGIRNDVKLIGNRSDVKRCKKYKILRSDWITDTQHVHSPEYSYVVETNGDIGTMHKDYGVHGICPMFALRIMR